MDDLFAGPDGGIGDDPVETAIGLRQDIPCDEFSFQAKLGGAVLGTRYGARIDFDAGRVKIGTHPFRHERHQAIPRSQVA